MTDLDNLNDINNGIQLEEIDDADVNSVTFPESDVESKEEGDDKNKINYVKAQRMATIELGELKIEVDEVLNELQNYEGMKGWKQAEKIISNLKNDLDKIMSDKGLFEVLTLLEMCSYVKEIPDEYLNKDIVEKTVKIIENLDQLVTKYLNEISNLLKSGLLNNFKDVPEPMGSNLVKNKDKIGELVKLLPSFKGEFNKLCKKYCTIVRTKGLQIWKDTELLNNFGEIFSSELKKFDSISEIGKLTGDILDDIPHIRNFYKEETGSKIYIVDNIYEIVYNANDFPKDGYIRFELDDLIFNFSRDNGVKLVRKNNNEEINASYLRWCVDGSHFYIKDEEGEVIWDDYTLKKGVSMGDSMKHINEDLAREIVEGNWRSYINLRRLESIDEYSARVLINNFKGRTINFEDLKIIDVPTAKVFATFPGEIHILLDAEKLTDNVAEQLIPIKERLITSGKVIKKIEEVETKIKNGEILNNKIGNLKTMIERTNRRKYWNGERVNIEFNQDTNKIKSWGDHEVTVKEITENSMKLEGLDLSLTLEEGLWLANFKNFIKYTYGKQRVILLRSTFCMGATRIINREALERFCPICKNDDAREKICQWLNK